MHKSASFVSGRTNPNSEENQPLVQSSVSLIGPDGQPMDTEEGTSELLQLEIGHNKRRLELSGIQNRRKD